MPTWDNPSSHRHRQVPHVLRLRAECPAKAIQVVDGQARVIQPAASAAATAAVCSQNAKQVRDDTKHTFDLLASGAKVRLSGPSFLRVR